MKNVLEIKGLNKRFGKIQAVNNLNLCIEPGQVYGILGPNGSGKTTTLGMILDVVAPDSGTFDWFDGTSHVAARKKIGAILETPCFYPYLTARQNLLITAHIKDVKPKRIDDILRQVGLADRSDDHFKGFSLGMKQRLSIAAALLSDPPVLILDEPTNGLDPQGIAEIRQLIREIASQGKTILLASHLLDEVQKVCTHFCVLRFGVKLHEGAVSDILGETNEIEVASSDRKSLEILMEAQEGIEKITLENEHIVLQVDEQWNASRLNELCFRSGITLKRLVTRTRSLEQEFMKILEQND